MSCLGVLFSIDEEEAGKLKNIKRKMNQFLSLVIQIFQSRRISRTLSIVVIFFYKAFIILYIWIISAETSKTDMITNTI